MKKLIEETGEGLIALLGEQVVIICACYIYSGKLVGVNKTCIKLEDPHMVYETGTWTDKKWKDAQPLGAKFHYIATGMIESFSAGKA